MHAHRRFVTALAGLLVVLGSFALCGPAFAVRVGDPAPGFTLSDLDGYARSLSDAQGSVVLLYFFGFNADVSAGRDIAQRFQGSQYNGLVVWGIDCWNGTEEQLLRMEADNGIQFTLLMNGKDTAKNYDLPYNSFVVIDALGTVRYVSAGPDPGAYDHDAIDRAIKQAMEDANAGKEATWGAIKSLYGKSTR